MSTYNVNSTTGLRKRIYPMSEKFHIPFKIGYPFKKIAILGKQSHQLAKFFLAETR